MPASSLGAPPAPRGVGAEVDALRSAYGKARATFLDARRDRAHLLGQQNAGLRVHTDFMTVAVDRRG